MTTLSTTSVSLFNIAQTFFIDPGSVKNSPTASLTGIGVYFKQKPNRNNNSSGITAPGVDLYLLETISNGNEEVPASNKKVFGGHARMEYDGIFASNSATIETRFNFDWPVQLDTGKSYAIAIKFDGDESYKLWKSTEGQFLVGTTTQTAGPAGKYIGKYFEYSYIATLGNVTGNTSLNIAQGGDIAGSWKPLNTTDLKFNVYVAKFIPDVFANTVSIDPVTGNEVVQVVAKRSYILKKEPYEFIVYNKLNSVNTEDIFGGETIYQNNVINAQTVVVSTGSTLVTGQVNFNDIFGNSSETERYIVIYSGDQKNVRKITQLESNNAIRVEIPLTFSNAAAQFSKVAAAKIDMISKTLAFGKMENALALNQSNANSSLRFVNNTIETVTVLAIGSGYSNSDYILVNGGGSNGGLPEVNAVANIVTYGNGSISSVRITDKGIGFLETPTYVIKAANGASSNGTSANLSFGVGMTLLTEFSNASFANCQLINVPVNSTMIGAVDIENPYGTSYYFKKHYMYYSLNDGISDVAINLRGTGYSNLDVVTFTGGGGTDARGIVKTDSSGGINDIIITNSGSGYTSAANVVITTSGGSGANLSSIIGVFRNQINSGQNERLLNLFERHNLANTNSPLILSRSYEVTQPNVTITTVTGKTVNTNVSSVLEMVITSNNVYNAVDILSGEVDVFYEKYAINNDYNNENTGYGSAISKHISKVLNFGDSRTAEDIRIIIDAFKPVNTDFKVFAKIHNNKDSDAFVDKDWTLLELKTNTGKYSARDDEDDLVEYEYGFYNAPNTSITLSGTVTTTNNSTTITGSNTTFNTDLVSGDLIKIYSPLFSNNYMIDVVATVSNSTSIVTKTPITNNNVIGAGLVIDKLAYPKQAFNNYLNNNITRYYNSSMAEFDGYNSFAIKIVFLSNNELIVPKIANIKGIGVSV
jgi:hypothetical protein